MILTRNQFFLLLSIIFIMPVLVPKLIWIASSRKTIGEMRFVGHGNLGSALGISTYPVIRFAIGNDTIYFNGNINLNIRPGDKIDVRYQKNNPSDAKVNSFSCIWADAISYTLLPILVLLVLYIMPERLDPIIPKKSKILIGRKPFIKIIKSQTRFII